MSTAKTSVCKTKELADQFAGEEATEREMEGGRGGGVPGGRGGGGGGYINYPSHCKGALSRGRGGGGGGGGDVKGGGGGGGQPLRVSFPWSSSDSDNVVYSAHHDDLTNASFPVEPGMCRQLL